MERFLSDWIFSEGTEYVAQVSSHGDHGNMCLSLPISSSGC